MNERLAHDHAELGDLLGEVGAALDAKDIARSHASLDLFWARLAVHIRAEHLHLFPAILAALGDAPRSGDEPAPSPAEAQSAIEALRRDHDFFMRELSQAVVIMRSLLKTDDREVAEQQLEVVRAKVAAVKLLLEEHNSVEEEGIYLWTKSLVSETGQAALAAHVHKELENMPPRWR